MYFIIGGGINVLDKTYRKASPANPTKEQLSIFSHPHFGGEGFPPNIFYDSEEYRRQFYVFFSFVFSPFDYVAELRSLGEFMRIKVLRILWKFSSIVPVKAY
jgi:hypothetical protein